MRKEPSAAKAVFTVNGPAGETAVRGVAADRTIRAQDGRFEDGFGPHALHLYEWAAVKTP